MIQAKLSLLSNFSFFLLFSSMFLFWIYTSFFFILPDELTKPSQSYIKSKKIFLHLGNLGMFLSNIILFLLLILRWKESGHFPLSNLYESLLFLSWSCTLIHLVLTFINKKNRSIDKTESLQSSVVLSSESAMDYVESTIGIDNKRNSKNIIFSDFTGCVTSPCALFTNAFASFCLPEGMQKITPLVPALQSNWLMMHVTVMIFSYSALIVGSLISIAFLVLTKGKEIKKKKNNKISYTLRSPLQLSSEGPRLMDFFARSASQNDEALQTSTSAEMAFELPGIVEKLPTQAQFQKKKQQNQIDNNSQFTDFATKLDNLSYRIIGLGFPFLTVGILSGAVWANEAWGSYWSWDPKETWALLTWLIFAIYLHTRISKGWEGKKPAIIASLGFLIIWICYLGVNLLGEGLHSYGWLNQY